MNLTQWRQIFRLIFPNASDNEFADRTFETIARDRSHKLITFEDLIMSLHELTPCSDPSRDSASANAFSPNIAEFVFRMMRPDEKGLVSASAFTKYVWCVFNLNTASTSGMSAQGVFGQMQISSHTTHPTSQSDYPPWLEKYALEQFEVPCLHCWFLFLGMRPENVTTFVGASRPLEWK
ncbi:unnamed protein product [Toxocara canis]|uniref:EF-hand domain-containing protein n=1 Tax=Toxocara canis TaxID=6265 RepID=A0A183VG05_TOXCA|nr:unnamed protein product [Toxocara canis]